MSESCSLWNHTAFEYATDSSFCVETAIELPVTAQVRPQANRRLLRRINAVLNAVQIAVAEVYDPE